MHCIPNAARSPPTQRSKILHCSEDCLPIFGVKLEGTECTQQKRMHGEDAQTEPTGPHSHSPVCRRLPLHVWIFFFLFKPLQTILKKPQPSHSNYPCASQQIIAIQPSAHAHMQTQY